MEPSAAARMCQGAKRCGQDGLRAERCSKFFKEIVTYENVHLGSCCFSLMRKLPLGKFLLGKMYFGKFFFHGKVAPWEIVIWENVHLGSCRLGNCTLGKLLIGKIPLRSFGKRPLGKYLTSYGLRHCKVIEIRKSEFVATTQFLSLFCSLHGKKTVYIGFCNQIVFFFAILT